MRRITFVLGLFLAVSVAGCATTRISSYDDGLDFRVEDTKRIIVGKTTSAELLKLFGEPYAQRMTDYTEESLYRGNPTPLWIYQHLYGTQTDQSVFFFPTSMRRKGWWKQLIIVLKNGIVVSYSVSDGPEGGGTR